MIIRISRLVLRPAILSALLLTPFAPGVEAQSSRSYRSSYLRSADNWQFRRQFPGADALMNAADFSRYALYGALVNRSREPAARADVIQYDFVTGKVFANPPRLPARGAGGKFATLVPEAMAMLDWASQFQRQLYDVWSDPRIPLAEKDGRISELVGHYRSRPDLALSAMPKSMDAMDAQTYSLSFRRKYPKSNALMWAAQWLQAGLYEPLMLSSTAQRKASVDGTIERFRRMLQVPLEDMPYLIPLTPAVAPTFARRYPEAAAILDNLHMLDNVVADILTSPEIPPSARRKEVLRAGALFRSDTAHAIPYDAWFQMAGIMGLNNMGGSPVGLPLERPTPSVPRGSSMAGLMLSVGAQATTDMAGMQHGTGEPSQGGMDMPDSGGLMAIYERMMADPVIRERVATDPVLQKMIQQTLGGGTRMNMPGTKSPGGGMNMPGMDGMNMKGKGGMNMPGMGVSGTPEDRQKAVEFIVRLLSDPAVAGKIQNDPQLMRLWADPDVQRRLEEMRKPGAVQERTAPPVSPAPPPSPPNPPHKHL